MHANLQLLNILNRILGEVKWVKKTQHTALAVGLWALASLHNLKIICQELVVGLYIRYSTLSVK